MVQALLVHVKIASDEHHFNLVLRALLDRFKGEAGATLLQKRGTLILRGLCGLLGGIRVFSELATILEPEKDSSFAASMTQALNLLLLTAPELSDLRSRLQNALHNAESAKLFRTLYSCWCHSASASLSLCMLAQAYRHVNAMIHALAELPLLPVLLAQVDRCAQTFRLRCWMQTIADYMLHSIARLHIHESMSECHSLLHSYAFEMLHVPMSCCTCRFVMLIDSPVFTRVRLQLLSPGRYPDLMRSMYSLLMLCPQSNSFNTLQARLSAVPTLALLKLNDANGAGPAAAVADPHSNSNSNLQANGSSRPGSAEPARMTTAVGSLVSDSSISAGGSAGGSSGEEPELQLPWQDMLQVCAL